MLSRSPYDSRIIKITSNMQPLEKRGSVPRFGISKFEELKKLYEGLTSTIAVCAEVEVQYSTETVRRPHLNYCSMCCPMHREVHWSRTPPPDRGLHFHIISRVPLIPLTEDDPRNRRAGMQNKQLSIALSFPTLLY